MLCANQGLNRLGQPTVLPFFGWLEALSGKSRLLREMRGRALQVPIESPGLRIGSAAALRSCFASLVLLALAGCMGPTLPNIETPAPGQATVFGRINVVEDGEPAKWPSGGFIEVTSGQFRLIVLEEATSKPLFHDLEKDGTFAWNLAPGRYMIAGFDWTSGVSSLSGTIRSRFSVPKAGVPAIYIGTLDLTFSANRYETAIRDDFDQAAITLTRQISGLGGRPVKGLMEIEEEPTGGARYIAHVCNKVWEVACGERYRGVEPLDPEIRQLGFPRAKSLQPTLKWSASNKAGVTYDVILYEAIRYESADGRHVGLLQGFIADYVEGLSEAKHQVTRPLKPGADYLWSVRLRKDDAISSWSTYQYDHFFIIGFSQASNLLFSFKTPGK